MPGAAMPILNTTEPIIGVDIHLSIPPIPPGPMPHAVVWGVGLSGWMSLPLASGPGSSSKATAKEHMEPGQNPILAGMGHACGRGHDAGPHLGHFYVNALLPIVALGAAAKAEFASGTVKTPQGNMAVNCAFAINLNLDCGDPVCLPSSVSFAWDHSVCAGFTWLDFFNGLVHMIVDFLIDLAIGLLLGTLMELGKGVFKRIFRKFALVGVPEAFKNAFKDNVSDIVKDWKKMKGLNQRSLILQWRELMANLRLARDDPSADWNMAKEYAGAVWDTFLGLSAGGPTGGDMPYAQYEKGGDLLDDGIDGLFYDEKD